MKDLEIEGMDQKTMTAVVRKLQDIGGKKIGLEFLPWYESATEETMWDIVRAVSPMANFRAIDGESEIVGEQAFDRGYADIVDIAVKTRFNASDLRKIKEAGMLPIVDGSTSFVQKQADEAKRKIRRAIERLKLRVDNRIEWLQINALQGTISFTGKVVFSVDYGIPGDQKGLTPTTVWSNHTSADPLGDLQAWQQVVLENSGVLPNVVIMSRKALNHAMYSTTMRDAMKYTNPILSIKKTIAFLEDNAGIMIRLYDTKYTDETGLSRSRFLAENKIIMLPSREELPEGVGDTATVGHALADYAPGYYTWQDTKKDPYGLEVGVGITAFPRIIHPEALLIATVF